jgi:hypothetical protein
LKLCEVVVDLSGDVALQAGHDVELGQALVGAPLDIGPGRWVAAHPTRAIRHKAWLARRSPPRFSRWRWVRPEDAGIGAVPHRWAKEASERSRWGLSPAVTSSWPAVSTPTPGRATRAGATAATNSWSWLSSWVSSACSCCQRRARVRRLALVAAVALSRARAASLRRSRPRPWSCAPVVVGAARRERWRARRTAARRPPPWP